MDKDKIEEIIKAGGKQADDWFVVPTMILNIDCPHCDKENEIEKEGLTLEESLELYFIKGMEFNCRKCGKIIILGQKIKRYIPGE